jgi:aryl sulfotransferase
VRSYTSWIEDNARWSALELRAGDIVISTPAKSGTTWMQQCCSVLIFQTATPPKPMADVSPWLDMLTAPLDEVLALLDAQEHRRFIKTHTPLDGLPEDDRLTYICVGRDPRDVAHSLRNHVANWNVDALLRARTNATGLDDITLEDFPVQLPEDPTAWFWQWVDGEPAGLGGILRHLQTFWDRRDEPNVHLFHHADLLADLPGQLRRLAAALSIDVPEARWAELVHAATFAEMKRRADLLAPDTIHGIWKSNGQFFDQGRNGRWHDWIADDALPHYDERVAALVSPDLAHWAHHGWLSR